jgi:hypothetical protein
MTLPMGNRSDADRRVGAPVETSPEAPVRAPINREGPSGSRRNDHASGLWSARHPVEQFHGVYDRKTAV